MSAKILDGKALAQTIKERLGHEAKLLSEATGVRPGLAVILVGDDPASQVYVGSKTRSANELGFRSELVRMAEDTTREALMAKVDELASDPGIHGMLVQLPLPAHIDAEEVQRAIPPQKDVDGFHPVNAGKLLLGSDDALVSCTPLGCMALIDEAGVELKGKEVVIVGRSNIVGKPLFHLMLQRHATVTICHSRTRDLEEVCRRADVLVAAVGVPGLLRGAHVKEGAVVIDVGINRITDAAQADDLLAGQDKRRARFEKKGHALVGDVHYGEAREKASAITPVPGGVGPLTVAMLLSNTLLAARRTLAERS
jgi:methylenetetrahydrofolate dehydrogenase (NADP+)/methenyltetrahydrofolate cyclohydrolase